MVNGSDLSGYVFGRWHVIEKGLVKHGAQYWVCRCDCGTVRDVSVYALVKGASKSCGCLKMEKLLRSNTKHGHARGDKASPEYNSWQAMWGRCRTKCHQNYPNYGGRGIRVCDRWRSFEVFLKDMGLRPFGCTIDRIDPNRDYEPGNCRWVTIKEQQQGLRTCVRFEFMGQMMTRRQIAEVTGIGFYALVNRINRGWPIELAARAPKGARLTDLLKASGANPT